MENSDVYRLLKGQIKYAKQKDGHKIYNFVCQEERQKEKQDFRVFSIGHPANAPISTKYVMLLEETGAGKTSFINVVLNYLFGVKFDDPFRLEVEEIIEDGRLETGSRTDITTVYTVHYQEGMKHKYNFVLIVIPGLADTSGQEQQQVIMQRLVTFFTADFGDENLNCLGIVTKGNRNTIFQNLPDEIKSFFKKRFPDITDIIPTSAQHTVSFDIEVRDTETSFRIIFTFDNDCLPSPKERDDEYDPRKQWERMTEQYDSFIGDLNTPPPKSFERSTHVHYCNKCKKDCWTCNKKSCMIFSNLHIALAVGSAFLGLAGIISSLTLKENPAAAVASSIGTGIITGLTSHSIGLLVNLVRKCKDSQCNHPISEHVKKTIISTKRTLDNEIIDEDMTRKRRKLSP